MNALGGLTTKDILTAIRNATVISLNSNTLEALFKAQSSELKTAVDMNVLSLDT